MNTVTMIAKNILVLLIAQVVSLGLGFYVQVAARKISRKRGVQVFGVKEEPCNSTRIARMIRIYSDLITLVSYFYSGGADDSH